MKLFIDFKCNAKHPYIDFIEMKTPAGKTITMDWDESEWCEPDENDVRSASLIGVYFDEKYANGRGKEIEGAVVSAVQIYSEEFEYEDFDSSKIDFKIIALEVEDGDDTTLLLDLKKLNDSCEVIYEP